MPFADRDGYRVHYQIDGPAHAPALMLSNSLGTSLETWRPQVSGWSANRLVVRYDTRGHGQSQTPAPPYTIERMANDALSLLDHLRIGRVDFCGLSMGGLIGMWIAAHHPGRFRSLVLANTSAAIGSPEIWNGRIETVLKDGMSSIAAQAPSRWFTAAFCRDHPEVVFEAHTMLQKTDPRGYAHCCAAIRDADLQPDLKQISVRTLILSGDHDPVIPRHDSDALAAAIAGSEHVRLAASHLSNLEQPARFSAAVMEFIN
jgi:3-oxoadipate enol-lactonase